MINEGAISNSERQYRNFCELVSSYKPGVEIDKVKVEKTQKGNWKVVDSDGNKVCLVSRTALSDELVQDRGLGIEPAQEPNTPENTGDGTN